MLKKVMIICLALSFVFIGGIAFAGQGHGPERGPAPNSGDCVPDGPGWPFISHDSSIILAADQTRNRDQDRLRERDGSCNDFISPDSSIILATDQTRNRDQDRLREKDGSCQG